VPVLMIEKLAWRVREGGEAGECVHVKNVKFNIVFCLLRVVISFAFFLCSE
jgi:hypothetical protein